MIDNGVDNHVTRTSFFPQKVRATTLASVSAR